MPVKLVVITGAGWETIRGPAVPMATPVPAPVATFRDEGAVLVVDGRAPKSGRSRLSALWIRGWLVASRAARRASTRTPRPTLRL